MLRRRERVCSSPSSNPAHKGVETHHVESRANAAARLDLEVSAGWVGPSVRGLWGGDALLLATALLDSRVRHRRLGEEERRALSPHRPREDVLAHPADTLSTNLVAAKGPFEWRLSKPYSSDSHQYITVRVFGGAECTLQARWCWASRAAATTRVRRW
jgi:hypothetical protein